MVTVRLARWLVIVAVTGLVFAPFRGSEAAERRCGELGTNCYCSEPLNTTSYTQVSNRWWNPGDSTAQECSLLGGIPGAFIDDGGVGTIFGTNMASVLGALPGGHSVSSVLSRPAQHGSTYIGLFPGPGKPAAGNGLKVRAVRWYQYFSPNATFTQEIATCLNTKLFEAGGGRTADAISILHLHGNINSSLFVYWNPGKDCCNGNWPQRLPNGLASLKGKWWRFEVHIVNPAGGVGNPARYRLFAKNVTDNAAELTLVDTAMAGPGWAPSPNFTPGSASFPGASWFSEAFINNFRTGTCNGFYAWSHFMYALWDTDSGQRIGPAYEIEGGKGPVGSPPSSPTGLTVR